MADPRDIYAHMLARGIPPTHALGMLNNIRHESAFNPSAVGDQGTSIGLFQHNKDRAQRLKQFAGGDWQDWRKQIDYVLTEPDTQAYLSQRFNDPADASQWFTQHWERPVNAEVKSRQRLATLPDVRMAAVGAGPGEISDVTDTTPAGDPITGRMDMPFPQFPMSRSAPVPPALDVDLEALKPSPIGALADSLMMAGAMFGNRPTPLRGALGAGVMGGASDLELLQLKHRIAQSQYERERAIWENEQAAQQEQYVRRYAAGLPPDEQALMMAIGPEAYVKQQERGRSARVGVSPMYSVDEGTGQWYETRYADDGTKTRVPIPNPPANLAMRDPDFLEQQAAGRQRGKQLTEAQVEAQIFLPQAEYDANRAVEAVDALLADEEGMGRAVGFMSMLPTVPGGKAADYEARLGQIYGSAFLQAYEMLKGGGQITEIEAEKATQAITDLNTSQSVEAHKDALRRYRAAVAQGTEKLRQRAGVDLPDKPDGGQSIEGPSELDAIDPLRMR